jgi:DNA mismatch repair protein MutS
LNELKAKQRSLEPSILNDQLKPRQSFLKMEIDRIQKENRNHILLVQVGMFYEIYDVGNYLDEISLLLNLRIGVHKKAVEAKHRYNRFAGFPMSELKKYLKQLLDNGKTVALVTQMEPHPISDVIRRKVSRIFTPGTILEEDSEFLKIENNFLLTLYMKSRTSKTVGLSWIDVSTGEFFMDEIKAIDLQSEIARIQPNEIIVQASLMKSSNLVSKAITAENTNFVISIRPDELFDSESAQSHLAKILVNSDPANLILANEPSHVLRKYPEMQRIASVALIAYLQESFPAVLPPIRSPFDLRAEQVMKIDHHTFQSLEITHSQREKTRAGSLLAVIETAKTAGGKRLFNSRIS